MEVGDHCLELCGLDPVKDPIPYGDVRGWLDAGFDPETRVSPVVAALAARELARTPDGVQSEG